MRSVLLATVFLLCVSGLALAQQPNIILVTTDDQSVLTTVFTPKINDLASEGVTFTNSFVDDPQCGPSRATVATGVRAINHPVVEKNYAWIKTVEDDLLHARLRNAGYYVCYLGKTHNGYTNTAHETHRESGVNNWKVMSQNGYDEWQLNQNGNFIDYSGTDPDNYSTDVLTEKAENCIENAPEPWLVHVSYYAPHQNNASLSITPAYRHRGATGLFVNEPLPITPSFNEADVSDKPPYIQSIPQLSSGQIDTLTGFWRGQLRTLQAVDEGVETLWNAVIARGLENNTMAIVTADNGFIHGGHRWTKKKIPYEFSLRVPLVMWGVGVPVGEARGQLVKNEDLTATILEAAETTPSPMFTPDGKSLWPILADANEPWRSAFGFSGWANSHSETFHGVRTHDWKYVKYWDGFEELYDLVNDPDELNNLANCQCQESKLSEMRTLNDLLDDCSGSSCWVE